MDAVKWKNLRPTMVKIEDFKLSCELVGHKLDVRAVTEGAGFIVSGSRDKTAKVWQAVG